MSNGPAQGYQVIARRWRPKQFSEVVGQDHIVRTVSNAIRLNRIAHAYLFVGPRGTGKTTTARLFAKSLNCENGPSVETDNESPICKSILQGNCMDVIEIDAASNNSVDQVRDLREECRYAPVACRYKIYIIDEVHMLSGQAFNALLKTLEEPPPHVKFIFATTDAHKVLPTIVSRCQRLEFRPIADEVIAKQLALICKTEGINAEPAALDSVARLAMGGMRDSQSTLDQLISFCGSNITEADVLDVFGLVSASQVAELARHVARCDHGAVIALSEKMTEEGRDLHRALGDLQDYFRRVLLEAIAKGGQTDKLGHPLSTESLLRILDTLREGHQSMSSGLDEKVDFEVSIFRAAEAGRARALDGLLKEISALAGGPSADAAQKKNN